MADKRPKMIVGLRWEETSGVDHPANEEEGWAIMKSVDADSDGMSDEELNRVVDEERAAVEKEQQALDEIEGLVKDAPDEVTGAFEVVAKWLKAARVSSEDEGEFGPATQGFLRQVFRVVRAAIKGPAPKTYSEKSVATILRNQLPDLIKDLALIFNDKDANKEAKLARVKVLLAALHESVEAALDKSDNEEPD